MRERIQIETRFQHRFDMAEARKSRSWVWTPQRFDRLDSNEVQRSV
jgi:hypothetical protein